MADLQTFKARPFGVVTDISPHNADPAVYNLANNIVFRDDRAERQDGYRYRTNSPLFHPEAVEYRRIGETNQYLYAGEDGIGLDTVSQNDITPTGYPSGMRKGYHGWTSLNSIPVWNHPDFTPHYHDGVITSAMQELPNWPTGWYCERMVAFKYYLLALAPGDANGDIEEQIRWSASADPGSVPDEWIPDASNDAGDMTLSDAPGKIIDAVSLGDNLIVYKPNACYFVEFIGGTFVFGQREVFSSAGILASRCAKEWRGQHFVVTEGDVILHNGSQLQSIIDGRLRNAVFDDLDGSLIERAFTYSDPRRLRLGFCYPSVGSKGWCDRRVLYDPVNNRWSWEEIGPDELSDVAIGRYTLSNFAVSWDASTDAWDDSSGAWNDQADPNVGDQRLEAFYDAKEFGEPTRGGKRGSDTSDCELIWAGKDLGHPTRRKLVDRVWINTVSPGGAKLRVQAGWQDEYSSSVNWGQSQEIDAGGDAVVSVLSKGRFFALRMLSSDEKPFAVRGFDIDFRDAGRF